MQPTSSALLARRKARLAKNPPLDPADLFWKAAAWRGTVCLENTAIKRFASTMNRCAANLQRRAF